MAAERWYVFIDTNVLIAGLLSRTGASAAILDLGEAEEIQIVVSQQVLVEADRVISAKFGSMVSRYREFIQNLTPKLIDDPPPLKVKEAKRVIRQDDAPILAAAKMELIHYLVTLDTHHFHTEKVRNFLSLPILTPGEFLEEFRKFWENFQQ